MLKFFGASRERPFGGGEVCYLRKIEINTETF